MHIALTNDFVAPLNLRETQKEPLRPNSTDDIARLDALGNLSDIPFKSPTPPYLHGDSGCPDFVLLSLVNSQRAQEQWICVVRSVCVDLSRSGVG